MIIKRNNPGNIRPTTKKWLGECTRPGQPFCEFQSIEYGCRAMIKLLSTYMTKHGLTTIQTIIQRWAPPSDNNDTQSYCNHVARMTGYGITQVLASNKQTLINLAKSMTRVEHGINPPADDVWNKAWQLL